MQSEMPLFPNSGWTRRAFLQGGALCLAGWGGASLLAAEAGAASLAAELFAEANGAAYIRTHAPGALRDGLKILKALGKDR